MPTRQFFLKNRSQGSLLNNIHDLNERKPPIDSPLHSPVYSPHSASASQSLQDNGEDYHLGRHDRPEQSQQPYLATPPTRSPSQRITQPPNHIQHPSVNVVTHSQGGFGGDDNPDSYYLPQSPILTEPKDDRRRRFFGLRNPKEPTINNVGGNNPSRPPGRHTSVRRKPQPQLSAEATRYSNSIATPASEQEREGGADRIHSHPQTIEAAPPPIPEKDPQRPHQLQNLQPQTQQPQQKQQHEIVSSSVSIPQGAISNTTLNRPQLERQISAGSSAFEDPVRSTQQPHRPQSDLQHQQPPVYLPSPSSIISTSPNHSVPPRGAHETLQQHYSDISRPPSQQSFGPPSPLQQTRAVNHYPYIQGPTSAYPPGSMAPPPSQQQSQGRNSHDPPPLRQPVGISREGSAYQSYSQNTQEAHQGSGAPPHYRSQMDANPHRAPPQQSQSNAEHGQIQGRSTPPPSRSRDDLAGLDPAQLLTRHDELQDKYRKVKKYYFEKEAQLQQLQNTLAHQRLSQSRTSLDDSEYEKRFNRLDGAINNLSFNVRKDWHAVPPWLSTFVNRDAHAHTQAREMVAVGRACISRWLVDELLDRYFHPCLDPSLSVHLKIIERNLRRFAAPTPSEEEKEALMARISNWRLATLDGLQDILSSPQADEYRNQLTEQLVKKLVDYLTTSLRDPLQAGVEAAVIGIVQLAVGITANLPQESRDVFVHYVTPGTLVNENFMKIESGLPPLTNPGEANSEGVTGEKPSEDVGAAAEQKENNPNGGVEESAASAGISSNTGSIVAGGANSGSTKETKKKSMFGTFMGGVKKGASTPANSTYQQQQQQQQQQPPPLPPQLPREERVRFSAFMAVEVRGRSVLIKAPVYV